MPCQVGGFSIYKDMAIFNFMVYLRKWQPEFQIRTFSLWSARKVNQGGEGLELGRPGKKLL